MSARFAIAIAMGLSLVSVGAVGCRTASTSPTDAAPAPSASIAPGPPVHVLAPSTETVWTDARSGDPLELARLADRVGADHLAEIAASAAQSAEDRASAIRALAYVDDPTPALVSLAALVSEASSERATLALETIVAVAPRRAPIEEVEPTAWRACAESLTAALVTIHGAPRRGIVVRALVALADRGVIEHGSLPAD